jgi:uncharacterized membrane protein
VSVKLRRAMVVVGVLGLALASYLVYVHYSGTRPACTAGDACIKVQTSVYSKLDGVPVALIGLIGYVGIFLSLLVPDRDEVRLATLVMTLIGVCFSGYLTYRELFTLKTICEECATSAVLMALLFLAAGTRYVLGDPIATAPPPPPAPPSASQGGKGTRAATQKIAS